MEAVNTFNMELYKHVVQIVEKFIKKCKPDLKVPGLYVVDSIVRQSRHQFGVEKDVFGPRFLKNFTETFHNLYLCSEDDRCKIVRVLNLWQKNGVFDMDIIQPLLDMANCPLAPAHSVGGPSGFQPDAQPHASSSPDAVSQLPSSHALAAVAQLFQTSGGQEHHGATAPSIPYGAFTEHKSSLAKKLLDRFDYDDDPEDSRHKDSGHPLGAPGNSFNQFAGQGNNMESSFHPHTMGGSNAHEHGGLDHSGMMSEGYPSMNESYSRTRGGSREDPSPRREGRQKGFGRRSRSGSRSPRRWRSRSTSRTRRSRHRRSGSQSREKRWKSRSQSPDRAERERDRERRQKGLHLVKEQTLSVCSTTLWVGQLDKRTQQSDVTSLLEEFGQIDSVNMIPPRGCAYIVMVHRQDASTALHKLNSGLFKVNQKPIKIAWALNKGIKSTHKKFWDAELGITYIPWSKVKLEELDSFREGGMLDQDSINPDWGDVLNDLRPAGLNGGPEAEQGAGTGGAPLQIIVLKRLLVLIVFVFNGFSPPATGRGQPSDDSAGDGNPSDAMSPDSGSDSRLGSPGPRGMTLLQGPRGMPPHMHGSPPGMHPHFLPGPNMAHMPPQMMFPPERFRMHMGFPPRGPPFHPRGLHHPMGPDGGRPFRNGGPPMGFGGPPFLRGRWLLMQNKSSPVFQLQHRVTFHRAFDPGLGPDIQSPSLHCTVPHTKAVTESLCVVCAILLFRLECEAFKGGAEGFLLVALVSDETFPLVRVALPDCEKVIPGLAPGLCSEELRDEAQRRRMRLSGETMDCSVSVDVFPSQ
ncbi:hypothetical protein NHX12_009302 [Muraenolepis orangiensis]|uniref:Uncharacterized protein n=1 Tax=Muraenolepis orangiensis TaxID=630683 RepID=A0A9Q0I8V7_9TELE|nr:hypothetical protein NHX12_009302 [Muraenolepis orangiensis]